MNLDPFTIGLIACLCLFGLVRLGVYLARPPRADEYYCTRCGALGQPRRALRGNFGIELLLWLCLILPGLIYTIWRWGPADEFCPSCQGKDCMIPSNSPLAPRALGQGPR
jgi:hypothetical protein